MTGIPMTYYTIPIGLKRTGYADTANQGLPPTLRYATRGAGLYKNN